MENLLRKSMKLPWLSIVLTILLSAVFFYFMSQNSKMETNLDKYMPQDHPAFVYSD